MYIMHSECSRSSPILVTNLDKLKLGLWYNEVYVLLLLANAATAIKKIFKKSMSRTVHVSIIHTYTDKCCMMYMMYTA